MAAGPGRGQAAKGLACRDPRVSPAPGPGTTLTGTVSVTAVEEVQTLLFADLAGFTALTEAHGDRAAAEIATEFAESIERLLEDERTRLVKTIGDEVMVQAKDPAAAIRLGRSIVGHLACHGSPPVRVGIHSGPVLAIEGDYFGATVNLASRVAGAARPGEVLVTEATRRELGRDDLSELQARGERYFKGVGDPVAVFSAGSVGGPGHELVIDPVCRMAVDPAEATGSVERRGRNYHFCSDRCADAFASDPHRYIAHGRRARAAKRTFARHLRAFVVVQLVLVAVWAVGLALGSSARPWFLLVTVGWGVPLVLHYRAIRHLL